MHKLLFLSLSLTPLFSYANQNLNPPKPLSPSDYTIRNNYDHAIDIVGITKGQCIKLTDENESALKLPIVIESTKRQKMFIHYDNQGKCGNTSKKINFTIKDSKIGETTDFQFHRNPSKTHNLMTGWKVYITSFSANTPINALADCFVKSNGIVNNPGKGDDCLYPKSVKLVPSATVNVRITLNKAITKMIDKVN